MATASRVLEVDEWRQDDRRTRSQSPRARRHLGSARSRDVLLESYRPECWIARLHARAAGKSLSASGPAALSGYGQTGPWPGSAPCHDLTIWHSPAGWRYRGRRAMTRRYGRPTPHRRRLISPAPAAQLTICAARSAAGDRQRRLSRSQPRRDRAAWQSHTLDRGTAPRLRAGAGGQSAQRGVACIRFYRAAMGGFVTLAAIEEKFWRNFCVAVGPARNGRVAWERCRSRLLSASWPLFEGRPAASWKRRWGRSTAVSAWGRSTGPCPHIRRSWRGPCWPRRRTTIEALFPAHVDAGRPIGGPPPQLTERRCPGSAGGRGRKLMPEAYEGG